MSTPRALLVFGTALAGIAAAWVLTTAWNPAPVSDLPARLAGVPDTEASGRDALPSAPSRESVVDEDSSEAWPAEFSSKLDDGTPEPDPARDGMMFVVREANGAPLGEIRIEVQWRKGFGLYGRDRGRTDTRGRFATTVRSADQIESVTVYHPELGQLLQGGDLLPSAIDPRLVILIVPATAPLHVRLVDLDGRPVPGASIEVAGDGTERPPREYSLTPRAGTATTDDAGRATVHVPVGPCNVTQVRKDGFAPLDHDTIHVGPGGATATLTALAAASRREVAVTTARPPGAEGPVELTAFSMPLPDELVRRLRLDPEQDQRRFAVRAIGPNAFTVAVDPLPWRLVADAPGCATEIADLRGHESSVHVVLQPAPPPPEPDEVARLVVTVLEPDGRPAAGAEVRIHRTPDLVYGADHRTDGEGRYVHEQDPGGRVCVSASGLGFARAIAGPVELSASEQELTLQLRAPLTLRGRVLDAQGRPTKARVRLRRPAGPLRALKDGVPAILPSSPTRDWTGTGPDGWFEYDDLYPGLHEVWAFSEQEAACWPGRARAPAGGEVTVRLGQGLEGLCLLTLKVVDAATGAPLAPCETKPLGYVDDAGVLRAALPPRELTLRCWAKEHVVTVSESYELEPGPRSIELRVPRSLPVFVRVVDDNGVPVDEAFVQAIDEHGETLPLMDRYGHYDGTRAHANRSGRAELRGLPAGELRLRVTVDDDPHDVTMPATAGRKGVFEIRVAR